MLNAKTSSAHAPTTHRFTLLLCLLLVLLCGMAAAEPAASAPVAIPVLCYHHVKPAATGKFEISTTAFAEQLDLLKSRGYQAINTRDLLAGLQGTKKLPAKPIMLTFDDGYRTVFDYAFPLLRQRGFVGVACIYPSLIGSKAAMSWEQMAQLASAGWTIEAHSHSHPDLGKLPTDGAARAAFLDREILSPKQVIERTLGNKCLFFTWPFGIYTEETEEFAKACGYVGALTVDGGTNYAGIDLYRIKRQVVYGTDSLEKFDIRLSMAPLRVDKPSPRPGEIVRRFTGMRAVLPDLADYAPGRYKLNPKVTGGALAFTFDPITRVLSASPTAPLKAGSHFIDIYLRNEKTGETAQHGWFFTVRNGAAPEAVAGY